MQLLEVALATSQVAAQRAFYSATMGWPLVAETPTSFTVQIGASRLSFMQDAMHTGIYHVAFAIPRTADQAAKDWLRRRVTLLRKDGSDEIFFANINARSYYYRDADGNILELIAHYNLDRELDGVFGPSSVLHVAEIGLPVADVPAFAATVREQLGLEPYGGPVAEDFAFLGDILGCLVVVKVGRPWLPTATIPATIAPAQLALRGREERTLACPPYPYTIRTLVHQADAADEAHTG